MNLYTHISKDLRRDLDYHHGEQTGTSQKYFHVWSMYGRYPVLWLFGMVLSLARQNKFPGIGQMFRYTLRDESNHIELFRNLFRVLIDENPDIWTAEFRKN